VTKSDAGAHRGIGHVPIRTCIGCRRRAEASELLRLAVGEGGVLCADVAGRMPGRGAWVHRSEICLVRALEQPALNRAFRGRVRSARKAELMAVVEGGH